jgi:hypothetical protein
MGLVSWHSYSPVDWTTGDEYAISLQVDLLDDEDKLDGSIRSPAEFAVKWKR